MSGKALKFIQPPLHLIPGYKQAEREADHSSPSSSETKNKCQLLPTCPKFHLHIILQKFVDSQQIVFVIC
jgi:hypothetical protein